MFASSARSSRIGLLALCAAVVLSGCSPSAPSSSGTSITVAQVTEPTQPDPFFDSSLAGLNLFYNMFDRLVKFDADGELVPMLAESWTPNEDFTQWDFTIRTDVEFHDGKPLTGEDIAFSFNEVATADNAVNRTFLIPMESVEVVEEDVIRFNLKYPFSAWPAATSSISIVPKAVYEELGPEAFAKAPIGSGPYEFKSWRRGVDYTMQKFDDYWGEEATVDEVVFQLVAEDGARVNGVVSGSLDLATIPITQADSVAQSSGTQSVTLPSNGVTFLGINGSSGVLADQNLRRAISLAIDKDSLVNDLLGGEDVPTSQVLAEGVGGYVEDFPVESADLEAARALVEESGYSGEEIPLEYATDGRIPLGSQVAQAIAGFLGEAGINVKLVGLDQSTFTLRLYSDKSVQGLYLNTFAPSTMDGDIVVGDLFGEGGFNNYTKDPDAIALQERTRVEAGDARTEVFRELAELNVDRALIIPLYAPATSYAFSDAFEWTPRVDGLFAMESVVVK